MNLTDYLQFITALVFVLALIGGFVIVARRFGLASRLATVRNTDRIGIVSSMPLDARRRLVLIRRDDREHLVILGQNSETIVETGICPASPPENPVKNP